jgi:hypothetical protein
VTDDTKAYVAITRLQAAYADVVTRRAWAELVDLFRSDATIRIDTVTRPVIEVTGPGELATFISGALARFDFFEFVILNTVIDVTGAHAASGRLYIVEVRHELSTDRWSNAFGLYEDSYTEEGGRWRFAARRYRSLARRTPDGSEILPALGSVGGQQPVE